MASKISWSFIIQVCHKSDTAPKIGWITLLFREIDCGATYVTEENIHDHVLKEEGVSVEDANSLVLPVIAEWVILLLYSFKVAHHTNGLSVEQSVRGDVKLLMETKVIRRELRERTKGYVYDVKTGLVRRVWECLFEMLIGSNISICVNWFILYASAGISWIHIAIKPDMYSQQLLSIEWFACRDDISLHEHARARQSYLSHRDLYGSIYCDIQLGIYQVQFYDWKLKRC